MRHGSLFSGIGGFDLAAEWMGWENVFHCEWMEFPRKVLDYYWPNADSHIDICKTDFTKYEGTIDIISGGFPCQPFSLAGKRKGTDDERYLWGEMLRAVQEIKPKFVIAENVFGITNIDGGLVFEQVCLDLEAEGYEVQPFIIPAAAKNAPHRRDRCWFVAYSNCNDGRSTNRQSGCEESKTNGEGEQSIHSWIRSTSHEGNAADTLPIRLQQCKDRREMGDRQKEICGQGSKSTNGIETDGKISNVTNTNGNGFQQRNGNDEINASQRGINAQRDIKQGDVYGDATDTTSPRGWEDNGERKSRFNDQTSTPINWHNFPTQSPICSGDDGLPTKLDGITFSKWRAESIKGYGNAIVPQIAYQLFQIIETL
jgi:DNA (cytosine-5)-methyltransferase 1